MNKVEFKAKQMLFGDTNESLAKHLGISRHTLGMKINEETQFRLDEVALIAARYKLSPDDVHKIFFESKETT